MDRADFYELTIALWPHAVAAGLQPVKTEGFETGEQYCREHKFFFKHAPDRADWWELCRQTPWMSCFENEPKRQIIQSNPWPLIMAGRARCDVDLLDKEGRKVGRISVDRVHRMRNHYHVVPDVGMDLRAKIVRGLIGRPKSDAEMWVISNNHYIAEEAMREAKGQGATDALLVKVGKRLLRAHRQREHQKLQKTA